MKLAENAMKKLPHVILSLFLLAGCDPNWSPYYTSIGDGFYYSSDKEYGVDYLVYDYEFLPNHVDSIVFCDTLQVRNVVRIDSNHYGYGIVDMHVVEFEDDDNFILAEQKPKDKFEKMDWGDEYDSYRLFRDEYHFLEYWIVDKRTTTVYGPLSIGQYHKYREQLGVPDDLKLYVEKSNSEQWMTKALGWLMMALLFAIVLIIMALPLLLVVLGLEFIIGKIKKRNAESKTSDNLK